MANPPITISHPSVPKLKEVSPTLTADPQTGYIISDKKVKVPFKSREARNSASLSTDVMVNRVQLVSPDSPYFNAIDRVKTPPSQLPQIEQQGGICQTIPFLHMIQSQLDYPIDYNFLWKCASPLPNLGAPLGALGDLVTNTISLGNGTSYNRLINILYSTECIPVHIACPSDKAQIVGDTTDSRDCNNPCNPSIRIQTVALSPPVGEQQLCDRLNKLGPMMVGCRGLVLRQLSAMVILYVFRDAKNITWDDVNYLDHDALDFLLEETTSILQRLDWQTRGHAVTLKGCKDGKFIIQNSYGECPDAEMTYEDLIKDFDVYDSVFDISNQVNCGHFYPVVTKCPGIENSPECKNLKCKEMGYDKIKDNTENTDCYCECIEVTPQTGPVGTSPTPIRECLNSGQPVQRVYNHRTKKCECPKPADSDYEYIGDDCCLVEKTGYWCEEILCDSNWYKVKLGSGRATMRKAIDSIGYPNPAVIATPIKASPPNCELDTLPPECSGEYNKYLKAREEIVKQFNVVQVHSIKIL